jgi:NhaP-type Na+/H+ or K+/H+ antiporter
MVWGCVALARNPNFFIFLLILGLLLYYLFPETPLDAVLAWACLLENEKNW